MTNTIRSVAVIGAGTMGTGIAALAANKNCKVLLLDISDNAANYGLSKIIDEKRPMLTNKQYADNIKIGNFQDDFSNIKEYDWICEAVLENIDIKREIFKKIDHFRNKKAFISSNTSGIPLKDITKNFGEEFLKQVCITHFFNPVQVMKLCELVPGTFTSDNTIKSLKKFLSEELGKGVVNAKDTVNFIGNRIGCFFMLKGLYEGKIARRKGLRIEEIDALLSKPIGLPPTGLYGLIDLIGLDVMFSVGNNLRNNLPENDAGLNYTELPQEELQMYKSGQLGRKSGGGFYRVKKSSKGNKIKEVYNPDSKEWSQVLKNGLESDFNKKLFFASTIQGDLIWNAMGGTLLYAADLVPEISNDIVNIDRAMKWGFAWQFGPFEMMDKIGVQNIISACEEKKFVLPRMLKLCKEEKINHFYKDNTFLSSKGNFENVSSIL